MNKNRNFLNCWEFNGCDYADKKCTIPGCIEHDGKNSGTNAGRCCWMEVKRLSTMGLEAMTERFLTKCLKCEFLKQVQEEEGSNFTFFSLGL